MLFPQLRVLFILIPLVELILFMVLGRYFGILGTLGLIVITAVLGANLTRSQGLQTLARLQQKLARGEVPGAEIIGGTLILTAGIFLITPGFLTDVIGFALLVPPLRELLGHWLLARCSKSVQWQGPPSAHPHGSPPASPGNRRPTGTSGPQVIDVETIEKPPHSRD